MTRHELEKLFLVRFSESSSDCSRRRTGIRSTPTMKAELLTSCPLVWQVRVRRKRRMRLGTWGRSSPRLWVI